jgi:hypothetical protein
MQEEGKSAQQEGEENRSKKVKSGTIMQGEEVRNRKGERIEVKRLKAGQLCKEKK